MIGSVRVVVKVPGGTSLENKRFIRSVKCQTQTGSFHHGVVLLVVDIHYSDGGQLPKVNTLESQSASYFSAVTDPDPHGKYGSRK